MSHSTLKWRKRESVVNVPPLLFVPLEVDTLPPPPLPQCSRCNDLTGSPSPVDLVEPKNLLLLPQCSCIVLSSQNQCRRSTSQNEAVVSRCALKHEMNHGKCSVFSSFEKSDSFSRQRNLTRARTSHLTKLFQRDVTVLSVMWERFATK